MRVEWEVGSQYISRLLECLSQCHSRHALAAGIESVKEQYCLFFLHIGLQRYSKNGRKPPLQLLSILFLTKIAQNYHPQIQLFGCCFSVSRHLYNLQKVCDHIEGCTSVKIHGTSSGHLVFCDFCSCKSTNNKWNQRMFSVFYHSNTSLMTHLLKDSLRFACLPGKVWMIGKYCLILQR